MTPLLVTAFFDIGRGEWKHLGRSSEAYITSFHRYPALLPVTKYLLAPEALRPHVANSVDYFDAAEFASLPAYKYLDPTRRVMDSRSFQDLFSEHDRRSHIEQYIPEYNVLTMMKWDALERAATATKYQFTHYVWTDFGLGRRHHPRPYLPEPSAFTPIERNKIVVSAQRNWAINPGDRQAIFDNVRHFRDQVASGLMIVPADLLNPFSILARESYEELLAMGLTSDDQFVVDLCVARRPQLFYLSFAPRGLSKFNHIHNILNGLDSVQPRAWKIPIWDALTLKPAKVLARWKLGLTRRRLGGHAVTQGSNIPRKAL